jgi:hypothetical protein
LRLRCHLEANRGEQAVEIIDDALVEPVELMPLGVVDAGIAAERLQEPRGQRCVDALEELEEDDADPVALGEKPVAARPRDPVDEALGAELRKVGAEGRQTLARIIHERESPGRPFAPKPDSAVLQRVRGPETCSSGSRVR